MTGPDLYRLLLKPLHATGLEYMVTGSVAAIAYGEPRMTNDVDVVLRLTPDDAPRIHRPFSSVDYYAPPVEVLRTEAGRGWHGHFNIVHLETVLRADVYIAGDDPLHEWGLANTVEESIGGGIVRFAPLEYVIVRKLEYLSQSGSDRHLRDIEGMLRVSGDRVDTPTLQRLIEERDLGAAWAGVRVG